MKIILLFICCLISTLGYSQYSEKIVSSRPGKTVNPEVVGSRVFQVQSGINITSIKDDEIDRNSYTLNKSIRIGILENFELIGTIDLKTENNTTTSSSNSSGITNTQLGFKYLVTKAQGQLPFIAVQTEFLLPIKNSIVDRENLGSQLLLISDIEFLEQATFSANIGLLWDGNSTSPSIPFTVQSYFYITDKIGFFYENYGAFDPFEIYTSIGTSYVLTKNLQLDISSGIEINNQITNWFIETGVSWRIDWRNN
ncbi:transporter [Aquimarina latercula]|uniref:transporter n=1 Tax=Aquimarina latercula TaxID=987 RepID=UPI0004187BE2|nr:transporter [Aquimarina latercula]